MIIVQLSRLYLEIYTNTHTRTHTQLVNKEIINLKESGKGHMGYFGVRKIIIKIKYQKYLHRNNENKILILETVFFFCQNDQIEK